MAFTLYSYFLKSICYNKPIGRKVIKMKLCSFQNNINHRLQVYHRLLQLVIESTHSGIYHELTLLQVESTTGCALSHFTRLKSNSLIGLVLYQMKARIHASHAACQDYIVAWELEAGNKLRAGSKLEAAGSWLWNRSWEQIEIVNPRENYRLIKYN